jgi:hypothetical protein
MKFEVQWLKMHISNGHLTWRPTHVCAGILSVNGAVFIGAKNVSNKNCGKKLKHTFYADTEN